VVSIHQKITKATADGIKKIIHNIFNYFFASGIPSGRSRRLPTIMRLAENKRSEV
jgi:hypothetical protein